MDKTASSYLAVGYADPVHFFRLRTHGSHYKCGTNYDKWSEYTEMVAGGIIQIFLPVIRK